MVDPIIENVQGASLRENILVCLQEFNTAPSFEELVLPRLPLSRLIVIPELRRDRAW